MHWDGGAGRAGGCGCCACCGLRRSVLWEHVGGWGRVLRPRGDDRRAVCVHVRAHRCGAGWRGRVSHRTHTGAHAACTRRTSRTGWLGRLSVHGGHGGENLCEPANNRIEVPRRVPARPHARESIFAYPSPRLHFAAFTHAHVLCRHDKDEGRGAGVLVRKPDVDGDVVPRAPVGDW